jgi:hypothetical protein
MVELLAINISFGALSRATIIGIGALAEENSDVSAILERVKPTERNYQLGVKFMSITLTRSPIK